MEKKLLSLNKLSPYIRKAGFQGKVTWKNKCRQIYDYEWMFCLNGKAYYEDNNNVYDLSKGSLLLIEPETKHRFWLDEEDPANIIWIHFDFEYQENVYDLENILSKHKQFCFKKHLPNKDLIRNHYIFEGEIQLEKVIKLKDVKYVSILFYQILNAYIKHEYTWQLIAKANWFLIFEYVINELTIKHKTSKSNTNDDLIKNICLYIKQNYSTKLTRKTLANYFGYNEDYLGKLFKANTKKTIAMYINDERINKAKEFLINSDLSIQNIAELVGFSDVSYFSKKMKHLTGKSPSEWRKFNHKNS